MRDPAAACEPTERSVQATATDPDGTCFLTHARRGRRNHDLVAQHTFIPRIPPTG
ncbi:hypothetical protein GCM10010440_27610 [Kitasatospora cinereorecta]